MLKKKQKYNRGGKYLFIMAIMAIFLSLLAPACTAQDAPKINQDASPPPVAMAQDTVPKPKSKIVAVDYTRPEDGYIIGKNFEFYDEKGQLVKTVADTAFPMKHPITRLNFEKYSPEMLKQNDLTYFKPLLDSKSGKSSVQKAKIKRELESLKQYGIVVRKPETANFLFYSPYANVRIVNDKSTYLIKCEPAYVMDWDYHTAIFTEEGRDSTKTLSQSTYISVYDYKSDLYDEVLILNKVVYDCNAALSDDGKYLLIKPHFAVLAEEGGSDIPLGMVLIDLKSKKQVNIPLFENEERQNYKIFNFKNKLFEIGDQTGSIRKYLDPVKRRVYHAHYPSGFKGTHLISNMEYFEF